MNDLMIMKQQLVSAVQGQMGNLQNADCAELGEAIDMIKDLSEAIYYCTVVEAMEDKNKESQYINYYTEPRYYYQDDSREQYGNRMMDGARKGMMNNRPMEDKYTGRSVEPRKMYMESKEMHHDKTVRMTELDKYMKELTTDLVEMIEESSPEEKQLLQQKLATLTNKIAQINV